MYKSSGSRNLLQMIPQKRIWVVLPTSIGGPEEAQSSDIEIVVDSLVVEVIDLVTDDEHAD